MNLFRRWTIDPELISLALFLSLFGIAMIYSAGVLNVPSAVTEGAWLRQLLWLVVALTAFTIVSRIRTGWIEWVAYPAYIVSLVLLAATLAIGFGTGTASGMSGWVQLGGFRFQPSEFAKVAAILGLARLLAAREGHPRNMRDLLAPAALMAAPMGLVMLQPDLGTAFTFVGILFAALFWAGTPALFLFLLASPGLSLLLAVNGLAWSAYFVGLAGILYAFRYRLFLAESFAVILANLAAGTMALPLWNGLGDYQRKRCRARELGSIRADDGRRISHARPDHTEFRRQLVCLSRRIARYARCRAHNQSETRRARGIDRRRRRLCDCMVG
jgi:rod shape determining protein RodA